MICYCGAPIREVSVEYALVHTHGGSPFCYQEEAALEEESRCVAMEDPDAEDEN